MQTTNIHSDGKIGKLEKRVQRMDATKSGGIASMVAKLTNAVTSIASEDKTETVREFAERFHIVEKTAFTYSDAILLHGFLVTLFESKNGTYLMHVDFRVMGEEVDETRAFQVLIEDRQEFDVIKAAIDYWKELDAFRSSNAEKWKNERVRLPASDFFKPNSPETETHSEPYMVTEFPFPFIPKIVRLTKEEVATKEEIDDIFYDLNQTLRGYERKKTTLWAAVAADTKADTTVN